MNDFDQTFKRTQNGIVGTGCAIIILNLLGVALIVTCVIGGCKYVQKNGLKNIANSIWEGEGTNSTQQVSQ
jgi:hypothetical protein